MFLADANCPFPMMDSEKPMRAPLKREALLEKALRWLSQRDFSVAELKTRLKTCAGSEYDVEWVLERLEGARFLDDGSVAERRARSGKEQRLVGRRRVEQELQARQVDPDAIREGVSAVYDDVDEDELARRFLQEKLRTFLASGKLEDPKELQRAYGRMRRAGFPHGSTVRALRQYSELAGNFDEMAGDELEG